MQRGARILLVILSVLVGIGAGWLLRSAIKTARVGKPPAAKPWHIKVGPDPCTMTDDDVLLNPLAPLQTVSRNMSLKHSIQWHSDAKEDLYILLHVPESCLVTPFANAKPLYIQDSDRRHLYLLGDGKNGKIDSGAVDPGACPSDPTDQSTWIKYDQCLRLPSPNQDLFWCCDGMIIIKP